MTFLTPTERQQIHAFVTAKASKAYQSENASTAAICKEPASSSTTASALEQLFGDDIESSTCAATDNDLLSIVEMEMSIYCSSAQVSINTNPLEWWKSNSVRFPYLSKCAQACLVAQATSVPAERVFSSAGDIITSARSCLTPENANILLFLQKNLSV